MEAACDDPQESDNFDTAVGMTAEMAEAHAVLLDEVATYLAYWSKRVKLEWNRYVRRLDEHEWTVGQIASLLGVSDEQAEDIVREHAPVADDFPEGVPGMKNGLVFPPGVEDIIG